MPISMNISSNNTSNSVSVIIYSPAAGSSNNIRAILDSNLSAGSITMYSTITILYLGNWI